MPTTPASTDRNRAMAVTGLLAGGALGALYLSSYLFLVKLDNPQLPPYAATPLTVVHYWRQYGDDPYTRRWLQLSLAGGLIAAGAAVGAMLRPVKRALHGDARFATRREVERAGLFGDDGIILGRWGRWGKFLMLPGQQGASCTAAPRSGKGAGLVQTNALSWSGSLVVNDVRKECYRITAGWRSLFSTVHLFDPLSETGHTAQYNPLSPFYIRDEPNLRINDILKLANRLSPNGSAGDEFWPASCRDLFVGVGLYVLETPTLPRTMGEVVRTVMFGTAESIGEHFRTLIEARDRTDHPLSPTCKMMLYDFIAIAPVTQSSIRKTFTSKLQLWTNPFVDAATSGDSFDLRELRRKKITIYFGVQPDDLDTLSVLTNLFFQQLYGANMDKMPEDDATLRYKILAVEDEFTAKGKVHGFAQKVGLMGGYNILTLLIYQASSQLDATYGVHDAQTIRECAGATVVFAPPPNALKHAKEISESLGNYTAEQESRSRQAWSFKPGNINASQTGRPLMNTQDVQLMGEDNEIVQVRGIRPVLCQKAWFFRQLVFRLRANLPLPPITPIALNLPRLPVPGAPARVVPAAAAPKAKPPRPITPADVKNLPKLGLTDYAVDFSKVELPKGEPVTDADLKKAFGSFMQAIEASSKGI